MKLCRRCTRSWTMGSTHLRIIWQPWPAAGTVPVLLTVSYPWPAAGTVPVLRMVSYPWPAAGTVPVLMTVSYPWPAAGTVPVPLMIAETNKFRLKNSAPFYELFLRKYIGSYPRQLVSTVELVTSFFCVMKIGRLSVFPECRLRFLWTKDWRGWPSPVLGG